LCQKHQEFGGNKAFSGLRYSDSRLLPQAEITHRATVRVQEASGSNPDTPTKKLESASAGSSFLIGVMGFERPLRKHAGGMFLGRGRIL